jgi:hypothetical protein
LPDEQDSLVQDKFAPETFKQPKGKNFMFFSWMKILMFIKTHQRVYECKGDKCFRQWLVMKIQKILA